MKTFLFFIGSIFIASVALSATAIKDGDELDPNVDQLEKSRKEKGMVFSFYAFSAFKKVSETGV